MLTEQQLSAIAARAEQATPGPWRAGGSVYGHEVRGDGVDVCNTYSHDEPAEADAAYIAAVSPDVVCALVEEVKELRAQRAALAGVLAAVETPAHNAAVLRSRVNMLDYTHGMESLDPAPAVEAR